MPIEEKEVLPNSTNSSTLVREDRIDYVDLGIIPLAGLGAAIFGAEPAADKMIGFDLSPEDNARFQAYLAATPPKPSPADAAPKKNWIDTLADQGWKIENPSGGMVITGVEPHGLQPPPKAE